jgi:hypothetical protein
MKVNLRVWLILVGILLTGVGVDAQEWQKTENVDAFTGNSFTQYVLTGKFLTPPKVPGVSAPTITLQCVPGERRYAGKWYSRARFIKGYFTVGAVLNNTPGGVVVLYRLDDGKAKSALWPVSTDGAGLFPPDIELNTVMFNHFMPHKENSSPPVKKLVLMADEYLGVGVVMEFDFSQAEPVTASCGLTLFQK